MSKGTVAVLVLVASAILVLAGWEVCHQTGLRQANAAVDSLKVVSHVHDSTVKALQVQHVVDSVNAVRADSEAKASQEAETLAHAVTAGVEAAVVEAKRQLDSAKSVADSVRDYRDKVVPALTANVASLHLELNASDSAGQSFQRAFLSEQQASAALSGIVRSDSGVIAQQQATIVRLSSVVKAPSAKWFGFIPKPKLCAFGGMTVTGHAVAGAGLCYAF